MMSWKLIPIKTDWSSWGKIRRKGALHFILVRGVLGWGGIMLLIFGPLTWLLILQFPRAAAQVSRSEILQFVLFFVLMGLLWGIVTWVASEIAYRRRRKNRTGHTD